MRFAVETWAPEYGAASDGTGLELSDADVDIAVELAPADWAALDPADRAATPYESVLFVDGVQRIDARLWFLPDIGPSQLGVCATWAAGAVRCNDAARVVVADVRRAALGPGEGFGPIVTRHGTYEARPLNGGGTGIAEDDGSDDDGHGPTATGTGSHRNSVGTNGGEVPAGNGHGANGHGVKSHGAHGDAFHAALGQARGDLEARVAIEAAAAWPSELVVVDGPLGDRRHIPGAVGYIKAHHVTYLPPAQQEVVSRLGAGQRTPLFRIGGRRFRFSWYLRLPGPMAHPGWGVVRCELPGEIPVAEAVVVADRTTASLPRFATRPHQDPRAPQNLHPIAGLERELRRRLGDPALLERALRVVAASSQ